MCRLGGNELKPEGANHVAKMLAVNQTLTSVGYAPRHALPRLPYMNVSSL